MKRLGSMKSFVWLSVLIIFFSSIGCQVEDNTPEATATVPATAVAAVTAVPTNTPPPPTAVKTARPTRTPLPTATATDPATAVPTETAVPTPEPTATISDADLAATAAIESGGCLPLSETANARAPYRVAAAEWSRPAAAWDSEVYTGNISYGMIHLGFDVEGNPSRLGDLLDVLDKHGVKTTMFVVGSWSESYPGWIREMSQRGHEFANHTWSHANMRDLSAEQVTQELNDTEQLIQQLTGRTTKPWFRPPFGSRSKESVQAAAAAGWTHVIWSGSAEDWREGTDVEQMCATLKNGAYPGSILYSHTSHPDIVEVVDRFIGEMHAAGYTFVPLSVIMSSNAGNYLISQ